MIIIKTPLRVSLFGGGTDFPEYFREHGGAVLGTAIDKYIYHTISKFPSWLFEHRIRFSYRIVEHVNNIDEIQHVPFREILKFHSITENIEVNLASDLPSFTGLGSSSAFTVGLMKGLHAFKGKLVDSETLSNEAINLERNILNECVGFQDQIFASYGGFNLIKFSGSKQFHVERININETIINHLSKNLLMFFTGKTRRAVEVENKKIKRLNENRLALDKLHELVYSAQKILLNNEDLDQLGYLLDKSWRYKKSLSNDVSDTEIDAIYDEGIRNGALGGKLLGAGGGGFMLFYVPLVNQEKFRYAFNDMHEVSIRLNAVGSSVIHSS